MKGILLGVVALAATACIQVRVEHAATCCPCREGAPTTGPVRAAHDAERHHPGPSPGRAAARPGAAGTVTGTVRDADGRPKRANYVVVLDGGSTSSRTDHLGRFTREVPDGVVAVAAWTDAGEFAVVPIASAGVDVDLTLGPGALVRVGKKGPGDVRFAAWRDGLKLCDRSLPDDGRTLDLGVPTGTVTLRFTRGDAVLLERTHVFRRGEVHPLVLALSRDAAILE